MSSLRTLLCAAILCTSAAASAQTADELIDEARRRMIEAEPAAALALLGQARSVSSEASTLARIELERGVVLCALERLEEARSAFLAALRHDPLLELASKGRAAAAVALFRKLRSELHGELIVSSDRPATVLIDGEQVGPAPVRRTIAIGAHHVELRGADGRIGHRQRVVVRVGQATSVEARIPRPDLRSPPRRRVWTWVAAAGGVALLAAGVGLGVVARGDHEEYQTTYDLARWAELRDSVPKKALAANVLFGIGGAVAAASVVLFILEGRPSERAEARLRVELTGVGAALSGSF